MEKVSLENTGTVVKAVYENVLDPVTYTLGLANGDAKRFVFVAGVTGIALWLVKPDSVFDNGSGRPWKLLEPNNRKATYVPWYVAAGITGTLGALFL
jgi:hypothetical protein